MENIEELFQKSINIVNNWENNKELSNEQKLNLYKYYKQSLFGDNNTQQPYIFNYTEYTKWGAWDSLKGIDCLKAKEEYIKLVNEYNNL